MPAPTNFVSYIGAGGEASHALAFPNAVQAGSTLVLFCAMFSTNPTTPTDGVNTWTPVRSPVVNGLGSITQAFYAKNVGAGSTTVTLGITSAGFISMSMLELPASALAPLDQANDGFVSGSLGPVATGGITGVAAGAWVLSGIHDTDGSTGAYTPPSGFTVNASSEQDNGGVGNVISLGYIDASVGGSFTPSWARSLLATAEWNEENLSFQEPIRIPTILQPNYRAAGRASGWRK